MVFLSTGEQLSSSLYQITNVLKGYPQTITSFSFITKKSVSSSVNTPMRATRTNRQTDKGVYCKPSQYNNGLLCHLGVRADIHLNSFGLPQIERKKRGRCLDFHSSSFCTFVPHSKMSA